MAHTKKADANTRKWAWICIAEAAILAVLALTWDPSSSSTETSSSGDRRTTHQAKSGGQEANGVAIPTDRFDPSKEEPEVAEPDPELGIILFGTVRDEDGEPVAAQGIWLYDDRDEPIGRPVSESDRSSYVFVGLKPGPYRLHARLRGFAPLEKPVLLRPSPGRQRFDLIVRGALRIAVLAVTPDDEPLVPALRSAKLNVSDNLAAVATREHPGAAFPISSLRSLSREGIGSFLWAQWGTEKDPAILGHLAVNEPPPFHVSLALRHAVLRTRLVREGTDRVRFVLSLDDVRKHLTTATVRVLDAQTGKAVPGRVSLDDSQTGRQGEPIGDDGSVTFNDQSPGRLELNVQSEGYERYMRHVNLEPGTTNDLGVIELSKVTTIEGTLVDESGKPIKCRYEAYDPDNLNRHHLRADGGRRTDEDGRFKVERLGRRRYVLRCWDNNRAVVVREVDTHAGSVTGITVTVPAGTRVTLLPDYPRDRVRRRGTITGIDGRVHHVARLFGRRLHSLWLAPGTYTLRMTVADRTLWTHTFTVASAPLEIAIPGS